MSPALSAEEARREADVPAHGLAKRGLHLVTERRRVWPVW